MPSSRIKDYRHALHLETNLYYFNDGLTSSKQLLQRITKSDIRSPCDSCMSHLSCQNIQEKCVINEKHLQQGTCCDKNIHSLCCFVFALQFKFILYSQSPGLWPGGWQNIRNNGPSLHQVPMTSIKKAKLAQFIKTNGYYKKKLFLSLIRSICRTKGKKGTLSVFWQTF